MKTRVIIGVAVVVGLSVLVIIATAPHHRTNVRYLMWKRGWAKYNPKVSLRYMNVDAPFRQSLRGLTRNEVRKWFPDLRTGTKPEQYLDQNQPFYITKPDFLWIGDSSWAIEFEDGRVSGFALWKAPSQPEDRQVLSEFAPSAFSEKPSS